MPITVMHASTYETLHNTDDTNFNSSDESEDSPDVISLRNTTRHIDGASALTSLVALVVLLADKKALIFVYATWNQFLPTTRDPTVASSMRTMKSSLESSCDIKLLNVTQFYVHNPDPVRTDTYLGMPMAFETMSIYPSLLLLWVLSYSAAFQAYRATRACRKSSSQHSSFGLAEAVLVCTHLYMWVRIMHVDMPQITQINKALFLSLLSSSIAVGWWLASQHAAHQAGPRYRPDGPDFARWVEYALTSPLQIIIVAGSVWIRDRNTLYALGLAQANMIMNGYIIEVVLKGMYKFNIRPVKPTDGKKDASDRKRRWQALFVLAFAWVAFAGIWYAIISQFQRQTSIAGKCDLCKTRSSAACTMDYCERAGSTCQGRNEIPDIVPYIVGSQCFLFALFGVVQSVQLLCSHNIQTRVQAQVAWYKATMWYSILSVVAKCTLEIGFLIMLRQMPKST